MERGHEGEMEQEKKGRERRKEERKEGGTMEIRTDRLAASLPCQMP